VSHLDEQAQAVGEAAQQVEDAAEPKGSSWPLTPPITLPIRGRDPEPESAELGGDAA